MAHVDRNIKIILSDGSVVGPGNPIPIVDFGGTPGSGTAHVDRNIKIILSDGSVVGPGNGIPIQS